MITILEGTDGVGKTTIAGWMAGVLDADVLHAGPPREGATWREEYVDPLVAAAAMGRHIVCDRWFLGELVWPAIFGRPSIFYSKAEIAACAEALEMLGAQTLLVIRDPAGIRATLEQRGEAEEQVEKSLAAQEHYIRAVAEYAPPNTTIVNSDYMIAEVPPCIK